MRPSRCYNCCMLSNECVKRYEDLSLSQPRLSTVTGSTTLILRLSISALENAERHH
jgi:hypothetical protein